MLLFMWPLVSNKAIINNWSISGFGDNEGEEEEKLRVWESGNGKLKMVVSNNESSNKSHLKSNKTGSMLEKTRVVQEEN